MRGKDGARASPLPNPSPGGGGAGEGSFCSGVLPRMASGCSAISGPQAARFAVRALDRGRPLLHGVEMGSLFAKKPIEAGAGRGRPRPLAPRARPGGTHHAWDRRGHRGRHLRGHRQGGQRYRRAGPDGLLHAGRIHLPPGRSLLRRVRGHDPSGRQCLHLHLHDSRRALRLDHRLGPHPGVRGRGRDGSERLVELPTDGGPSEVRDRTTRIPRLGPDLLRRRGLQVHRGIHQPAGRADRRAAHDHPREGDQGECCG